MTFELQAAVAVVTDSTVDGRTVVPIPPSVADAAAGEVRLYIHGAPHARPYNAEMEQP